MPIGIICSILNFTSPYHRGSGMLLRMKHFAFEAHFPTSEFCWLIPRVSFLPLLLFFFGSAIIRDCPVIVAAVLPIRKEVVGLRRLCTDTGVFEMLAGDVFGTAANFDAALEAV